MRRFAPRPGLRGKLMAAFFLVVIIPSSLIGWMSYKKSSQLLEEQAAKAYNEALQQASINITYRLREVETISELLFTNVELQRILRREKAGYGAAVTEEMLEDFAELRRLFGNLESNNVVYRVRLFVMGSSLYSQENNNIFRIDQLEEPTLEELLRAPGHKLWKYTYVQNYLFRNQLRVISLFRVLKDMYNLDEPLGVAAVDIEERVIREVFEDMHFTKDAFFLIYHGDHLITSYMPEEPPELSAAELHGRVRPLEGERQPVLALGGREYLALYQTIGTTGWTIAALIPLDEIVGPSLVIGHYTVAMAAASAGVAVLAAALLAHRLTRGIRLLIHHMQSMKMDPTGKPVEITGSDEIAALQAQYNSMMDRIRELIEEVYKAQISKQAAELKALESQINPHFLYNTLDTIKWMGMKMKADPIVSMVDALSRFFRLSLNSGREFTTVEREIGHVKAYMHIQSIRFGSRIACYYEVDEAALGAKVLKLILQPLVENAIVHGIQSRDDGCGAIWIRAKREDRRLLFEVADDGPGISEEGMEAILRGDGRGYGARNVHQRIRLYYGAPYGLRYANRPEGGCCVQVLLPYEPYAPDE
mgnify:CR=1 FL=1